MQRRPRTDSAESSQKITVNKVACRAVAHNLFRYSHLGLWELVQREIGKVYQKRPGHWYIQLPGKIRIYCDKDHQSLDSKKRAEATLVQIYTEMAAGTFDPDFYRPSRKSQFSFSVYCDDWLKHRERLVEQGKLTANHHRITKGIVENHLKPYFEFRNIKEITPKDIKEFQATLNGAPKSIFERMQLLMKIFRDAKADKVILEIPTHPEIMKSNEVPDPDWRWCDEEIQERIFAHLSMESLYFILFQAAHATRNGETRALQHQDIDTDNGTVTIRRAFSGRQLRHTKTKNIRVVPLDPVWKEMHIKMPTPFDKKQFVFLNERGKPHSEHHMTRQWNRACEKAGIEGLNLYSGTRHSLASQAVNRGVSLYVVSKFLGHTNIKTTMKYAHLEVEPLRQMQRKATVITLASNLPPKAERTTERGEMATLLEIKRGNSGD